MGETPVGGASVCSVSSEPRSYMSYMVTKLHEVISNQ